MSNKILQRRTFSEPFKVRTNADGTVGVRGYAAVFDYEAHGEVIRSAAFNRTIAQRDDIRLLVNHDGVPLARTKSGTLDVGVDERGLWFDAPGLDPANPRVQELLSAMARQDIDQCSFAGYFTDVRKTSGVDEVYEVRATDVSIVTYPWYDETTAGLTGRTDVDRALVAMRSLSPEDRELTIVALGDLTITAPVADSSIETETNTGTDMPAADGGDMCDCPTCGGQTPANGAFCCCCGAPMGTDPIMAGTAPADNPPPRSLSIAEARALLGL